MIFLGVATVVWAAYFMIFQHRKPSLIDIHAYKDQELQIVTTIDDVPTDADVYCVNYSANNSLFAAYSSVIDWPLHVGWSWWRPHIRRAILFSDTFCIDITAIVRPLAGANGDLHVKYNALTWFEILRCTGAKEYLRDTSIVRIDFLRFTCRQPYHLAQATFVTPIHRTLAHVRPYVL